MIDEEELFEIKKICKKLTMLKLIRSKIGRAWLELNFKYNKNFIVPARVEDQEVLFWVDSFKEYFYRAKNSFSCEQLTVNWIKEHVGPDDVLLDIGANVGAYSIYAAKKIVKNKGNGCVFSIEPEAGNFFKLNRNIQLNSVVSVVYPVCMAFGSKTGIGDFYLSSTELGSACHALGKAESDGNSFAPVHRQNIFACDLDSWIKLEGTQFPNHIKIDVDGLEKDIIFSADQVLKDRRLKSILIELDLRINQEVEAKILGEGFFEFGRELANPDSKKEVYNILYLRK